jgi:hypothetical protein
MSYIYVVYSIITMTKLSFPAMIKNDIIIGLILIRNNELVIFSRHNIVIPLLQIFNK